MPEDKPKGPDEWTMIYIDNEPVMVQGTTITGAELRELARQVHERKIAEGGDADR